MNPGKFLILVTICITLLSCSNSTEPIETNDYPLIYITIAGHIEDTAIYTDCDAYPVYRGKLLDFAEMLSETGASFNLQIDYEFLYGALNCEMEAMRAETDGLNTIDYLATYYGFEIDAHQEGGTEVGQDNYADVRYLGGTLTSAMSDNVGGLVWDDPAQFARLATGEQGLLYPQFTWLPDVLTLAVSHTHHAGDFSNDDIASGVWKPKGANDNFWVHDLNERMVYIGPGEHTDWGNKTEHLSTPEFVEHLVNQLESGAIPGDMMYTVSLAVPESVIFNDGEHSKLLAKLDAIEPYILSGQAQYVTYSEALEIWMTRFESQPNIYYR